MKSPLLYLLEVLFCSGLLMAFYRLLLLRKTAYKHCRRYLVAAVLLSVLIPALNIPLYPARTVVYPVPLIAAAADPDAEHKFVALAAHAGETPVSVEPAAVASVDWPHLLRMIVVGLYFVTTAVLLILFAGRLAAIRRLRRHSRLTDCGDFTLAENAAVATPFSFLRTVFMGEGYEGRCREIVIRHETSHIRHRHSAERIAVEAVRCFFWFNPFVWIAARWLAEAQEWEADRDVIDAGYDLTEYRTILFRQLFGYNPDIACGLNRSLTKNRFAMMTQFKKRRSAVLRLGAAIPVVAGMMMLCSFTTKMPAAVEPAHVSHIHIASDGTIALNGHAASRGEIADFVAAEREKLAAAERADWVLQFTADSEPSTVPVDTLFSKCRIRADRLTPLSDGNVLLAGNVRIESEQMKGLSAYCDSALVHTSADKRMELFGRVELANEKGDRFSSDYMVISRDEAGALVWRMKELRVPKKLEITAMPTIVLSSDGRMMFYDEPVSLEELRGKVAAYLAQLPEAERRQTVIALSADTDVQMGPVTDIKQALRSVNALRISYFLPDLSGSVDRILPPDSDALPADSKVKVVQDVYQVVSNDSEGKFPDRLELRIKERNLFLVLMNGRGEILAGQLGRQEISSVDALTAQVKAFLLNAANNAKMPEKRVQEFTLSDGRTLSYPVSEGIVSIQTMRDTPYGRYIEMQRAVGRAFDEIRDEVAAQWFGEPFGALTDPDREVVMRAVPLKISEAEPRSLPHKK